MQNMNFPNGIKVISLSLDKNKDYDKWKILTIKMDQEITYHLDNNLKENEKFLEFVELNSIPRYILIDKNLNLINQAFYHPDDPQFLRELEKLILKNRNSKFSVN